MHDARDEEHSHAVLKEAVENTNEAFVTIDGRQKVVFFNKAAERIFGFDRNEVLGHDLDLIMSPSCSRNHHAAVERYVKTNFPTRIGHGTEIMAIRKNGETFPANISFSVAHVGEEVYFTGIVRDLSETNALRELVRNSERLAAMGQVVAEIIHEIKNPLIVIGGFARQLVREIEEDGRKRKKLGIIVNEIVGLEKLLQELRNLFLPRKPELLEVDLVRMLRSTGDLVEAECKKYKIRLGMDIGKEPLFVLGDEAKLKEVLLNLARNAIEAMKEGGTLVFSCHAKGQHAELSVSDEGSGISPSDMEKIFTPFFTTKTRGTGLGLSICKRIIEDHPGGSLTFESEPGKGTTFKIVMPLSGTPGRNLGEREQGVK